MTKCELESDSDNTHAKEDEGKTTRTKPYAKTIGNQRMQRVGEIAFFEEEHNVYPISMVSYKHTYK